MTVIISTQTAVPTPVQDDPALRPITSKQMFRFLIPLVNQHRDHNGNIVVGTQEMAELVSAFCEKNPATGHYENMANLNQGQVKLIADHLKSLPIPTKAGFSPVVTSKVEAPEPTPAPVKNDRIVQMPDGRMMTLNKRGRWVIAK